MGHIPIDMGHTLIGPGRGRAGRPPGAAAVLAVATLLFVASPVNAAITNHPAGGSNFTSDTQGWVGSDTSCSIGAGLLCSAAAVHETGVGNPAGSITTRVDITLNLIGLFQGRGVWTSPTFTVPAGRAVTGATFAYDRRLDPGGLLSLQPRSTVAVRLIDETAGSTVTLLTEQLGFTASTFARRGVGVPVSPVVAGHSYRLRIETSTTSTLVAVGVLGQTNTRFDNVVLAVDQASTGGGGGGSDQGGSTPVVSPGVTTARSQLSDSEMRSLFGRFNENTETGSGPGGSLVPVRRCTIVGTAGADRVKGTSGNDIICGLGGNDVLDGAGGIDIVDGANGNDRLSGGPARDKLIALRGNDRAGGGGGNDRAGGGAGRDRIGGGSGADRLGGGSSRDLLRGFAGNDRLTGGKGRDRLLAGAGNDRIRARDRTRDRVDGGRGFDRARVDRLARGARPTRTNLRRVDRVRRVERQR